MSNNRVLLIGAGEMGQEYYRVLKEQNVDVTILTRSMSSAAEFTAKMGKNVEIFENFAFEENQFTHAINAVSVGSLKAVNEHLFSLSIPRILCEKPAGLSIDEVRKLLKNKPNCVDFFVGYNRRFYSSVEYIKNKIEKGYLIRSVHLDFSEIFWKIDRANVEDAAIQNWFFANSTHTLDLLISLIGKPEFLRSNAFQVPSKNTIFDGNDVFHGFGRSQQGIPFSYHADFHSAGRWKIDIGTNECIFTLSPLEEVSKVKIGNLNSDVVFKRSELDLKFKPGLFRQCEAFLTGGEGLVSLEEHVSNCVFYEHVKDGLDWPKH